MATYTGTTPSGLYATLMVDLNLASQNVANNTSTINYKIYLKSYGGGYPYSNSQYPLKLNADGTNRVNTTSNYQVPAGGEYTLNSGSFTVNHNSDGRKSFNFDGSFGTHAGTATVSGSYTLPSIARSANIDVRNTSNVAINSAKIGDTVKLNINGIVSGFTYKIGYWVSVGASDTGRVYIDDYNGTSSYDFTIPSSWLNSYYKNLTERDVSFFVVTYSNGVAINEGRDTIKVSASNVYPPIIDDVVIKDLNTGLSEQVGDGLYQGLSDIEVIVRARGQSGASIQGYNVKFGNEVRTSTSNSVFFGSPRESGNILVTVKVTDSRGMSAEVTQMVQVKSYTPPNISTFIVTRRSDNTMADAVIVAKHNILGVETNNPMLLTISYRTDNDPTWVDVYSATVMDEVFSSEIYLGDVFQPYKSYEIMAKVVDNFRSHYVYANLTTADIAMALDKTNNNIGVGMVPRDLIGRDSLDVKGAIFSGDFCYSRNSIISPGSLDSKNWNSLKQNGWYSFRHGTGTPFSTLNWGVLGVLSGDLTTDPNSNDDKFQIAINAGNELMIRNCVDSISYGSWKNINGNGQGRVESFSKNSNGYIIKYEGGFMEQVKTYTLNSTEKNFTTGSAGFYGGKTIIVNYDEPFIDEPFAVANVTSSGYIMANVGASYYRQAHIRVYSPNQVTSTNAGTVKIVIKATGSWK